MQTQNQMAGLVRMVNGKLDQVLANLASLPANANAMQMHSSSQISQGHEVSACDGVSAFVG